MANTKLQKSTSQVDDKSAKLKEISSVIRALVTSRKPPCALNDILNDYRDIEGKHLPHRQLGFNSAEDLLIQTGEFQINRYGGKVCISAKYSDKSAHIAALVRGQKSSKSKMSLSKPRPPTRMDNTWNKNTHITHYYKNSSGGGGGGGGDRNNNNIKYNANNIADYKNVSDLRERINQPQQHQISKPAQQAQSPPVPVYRQQKSVELQNSNAKSTTTVTKPRAILGQKNTSSKPNDNNNEPSGVSKQQQQQQQPQQLPQKQKSLSLKEPKNLSSNIQHRLKITTTTMPTLLPRQPSLPSPPNPVVKQTVVPKKQVYEFNPKLDAFTSLSQYCSARGFPPPEYKVLHSKYSKLFQCRIFFNDSIFSTYPNEYPTENLARISCAEIAINQIRQQEQRNPRPICTDTDKGLIDKLFAQLVEHPHGIFVKNMPECFENTYEQSLPDHWWTLVQTSNRFITETLANDKVIILANTNLITKDEVPQKSPSPQKITLDQQNGCRVQTKLEELHLPWHLKYWNVHVTYCVSTVEVWVRLIGPEYSEHYDAVYNEIDRDSKVRCSEVKVDQIYLAFAAEGWHRVRVREVETQKGLALCHFVDFGDTDWLALTNLCECDGKYLSLPAQAVSLSLFGLEDFAEHPVAHSILSSQLLNNSFVAEILTKETEFFVEEQPIRAVFYDTSSDVDINKNPILLQLFCDNTPAPQLKSNGITKVHITSVNDNGDIYMQILGRGLLYVEKLIQKLVESKFKRNQHQVSVSELHSSELYLISSSDGRWYRGKLLEQQRNRGENDVFDVFIIDCGITQSVRIGNMFRLESLSAALSKFPAQAIKVQLHNIPPLTEGIVGRMRALMPSNCEALAKLAVPADVPLVTVYRRAEGPDTLCTVNDVIRIEFELECGLETNTDFTGITKTSSSLASKPKSRSGGVIANPVPTKINLKSDNFQKLMNFNEFPEQYFQVRVTLASNPSNFVVQPYEMYRDLCLVMKDLQNYCENNENCAAVSNVQIGEAYVTKNPDGYYHRAIVEKKINDEMINVRFCDFGDFAVVHISQLKPLPQEYRFLPKMGIAAKLYDAKPIDGDWSLSDCKRFRELTVGKKFVSIIKGITKNEHDEVCLSLILINVDTNEDIYIDQVLRAEKLIQ